MAHPRGCDPSVIDVLIVGAGIGGLFTAIELHRHGHNVRVIESRDGVDPVGDFVGIGVSATRQFAKWPGVQERYQEIRYKPSMAWYTFSGEHLAGPMKALDVPGIPVPVHRPKLQQMLYDHAKFLGIDVAFGKHVEKYIDRSSTSKAGVLTTTNEVIEADLVVAADGVGSKSWQLMQEGQSKTRSSGFAVYRVAFPTELAHQNSIVSKHFPVPQDGWDDVRGWLGPDTHLITATSPDIMTWLYTHKDSDTSTESWSRRISSDTVLQDLSQSGLDWHPAVIELIKQTPPETIVDWRLLWRDPRDVWVSESGRVIQIGDAAHSFIPTSGNGGTQACEDGMSLAACLSLGGRINVALATRVHNMLRADRISCCQRSGFRNRDTLHNADFGELKKHPERLGEMTGRWITQHDAEQYVYDNWEECVNCLVTGRKFVNTNIPPGYTPKPWSIDDVMHGETRDDEGEWT
ncbi:hypothetical protein PV08_01055 [Exophiala spinifera]|uniref:FAD-binding domain-containing protein n=1 Tax=Exophiala spinifera TaxID=91928 RepID=A0A0D2BPN1_9EURO|nr:uncharacterized protein PV08_01055 [Exophiala spinifera]KIW20480.1 hypothetical protein PV08_01055 [Exophiala spinifera]